MQHDTFLNWLPAEMQGLFDRAGYYETGEEETPLSGAIALVGLPGAGKKTLYNSLCGFPAVTESSEKIRSFGLFTLVDRHSDRYDHASTLYRLERSRLNIYVVDARLGLQAEDIEWLARLRAQSAVLLVALNKIDQLSEGERSLLVASIQQGWRAPSSRYRRSIASPFTASSCLPS